MPNDQAVSGSRAASARAALANVEPRPGVPKPDPIMVADHVRRSFGGLTAVNVEHVEIQRGAITALIGPNGAGKTTFFNLITGFDNANEGTWTFNDRQVAGTAPYKLARIGMVRTFQLTKAGEQMKVASSHANHCLHPHPHLHPHPLRLPHPLQRGVVPAVRHVRDVLDLPRLRRVPAEEARDAL